MTTPDDGVETPLGQPRRNVDITLLREALRMTPAERIKAAVQLTRDAELIAAAGRRSGLWSPPKLARIAKREGLR